MVKLMDHYLNLDGFLYALSSFMILAAGDEYFQLKIDTPLSKKFLHF